MEEELKTLYYDPKEPSSYSSKNKLYKAVRRKGLQLKRKDVEEWLERQEPYTMHAPIIKKGIHRRRIVVPSPFHLWECDLFTIEPKFAKEYKYILTVIDAFTKVAHAEPLKTKRPLAVIEAFKVIIDRYGGRAPKLLRSDQGKEFTSAQSKKFWISLGIKHYIALAPVKASFIERFNRTLGEKIEKFLTASVSNKERNFLPQLQDFIDGYNNSVHSAHGLAPNEVNFENAQLVYDKLFGGKGRYKASDTGIPAKGKPLERGDLVRLSRDKIAFEKGRKANYTREIFKISKKMSDGDYLIEDYKGDPIKGQVYREELQKVSEQPELHEVRVLQRKGKQVLVHWIGYPDSVNEWIPRKNLEPLHAMDRAPKRPRKK